jgi:DNA processing protein
MFSADTPSAPYALPATEQDRLDWLRLIRSRRVGPATFQRLIEEFGTPGEALRHLPEVARAAGVRDYAVCPEAEAAQEFKLALKRGFLPLFLGQTPYPALLARAGDAPPFLWSKGDPALADRPTVALVGARNASSLGIRTARLFARELGAAGITVVSGLARGVDAAAHTAAMDTGTVAVQAGGIDIAYPKENAELFEDIGKQGLRLSEQPLGLAPQARHFPQRNRIIAGLSLGVVVIKGAARSGSLITARDATDLGREVMAVPGNPQDARAGGCNILIRDGATLVRSAADIIEAIAHLLDRPAPVNPEPAPEPVRFAGDPDQVAAKILTLLGPSGVAEDALIRDSGYPASAVAKQILELELDGRISRTPGGLLALTG